MFEVDIKLDSNYIIGKLSKVNVTSTNILNDHYVVQNINSN